MRNKIKILTTRLLHASLALLLIIGTMPAQAASRYVSMDLLSGSVTDLDLQINQNSKNLDLAKTSNIRIRIQPKKLYTSLDNMDSFRINVYEIINGDRNFVTSRNSTINKESRIYKVLSVDAGRFVSSSKTLEFDVFDTEGKLVNIYGTTLEATNLATQVSAASSAFEIAACEANDFDCLIQGIFERVTIEAKKQRQATTGFEKEDNGRFKLTVPVPVDGFKVFRGNRVNLGGSTPGNQGGGNGSVFGETAEASFVRIGDNATNHAQFSYDPATGLNLGFIDSSTTVENKFAFNEQGRLGIGVNDPQAFIHVRNSMNPNVPSMIIEPGSLTNGTPANGAIEFDGNNLYLTKGGVRSVLGATGAQGASGATGSQGPAGATGAQGPAGPAGADGTLSSNSGAIITGDLVVDGNVTITGSFNGDGSLITGLNLGSATVTGGDINEATINGATLTETILDGVLSFTTNASIFGDVSVNGTVFANFFNGDGFLITNINPLNINGNVLNSNNATMANFATNAGNATLADFATTAGNADLLDGQPASFYANTDLQTLSLDQGTTLLRISGSDDTVDLGSLAGSGARSESEIEGFIGNDVTNNFVARSDGTKLVTGTMTDNGSAVGIGIATPSDATLEVAGIVKATSFAGAGTNLTGLSASNFTGGSIDATKLGGELPSFYLDSTDLQTLSLDQGTTLLRISGSDDTVDLGSLAGSGARSESEIEGFIGNDVTENFVPRSNGTKILTGSIYDNGSSVGIGVVNPTEAKLEVAGDVKATQFLGSFNGSLVGDGAVTSTTINGETTVTNKFILNSSLIKDILEGGSIPVTSGVMRIRGFDGAAATDVSLAATQIALGSHDGEFLIIRGMDNDGKVMISDGGGLLLNAGVGFNMGANDTLTLIFDQLNGQWIEITRSDR